MTRPFSLRLSVFALILLSSCAAPKMEVAEQASPSCTTTGFGLTSPPSAETTKAIAQQEEYPKLSLDELLKRLATGDSAAQLELGLRYANGTGLETDIDRSVTLIEASAKQGNPVAQYFLGTAYSNGIGQIAKDDSIAVLLWESASRAGYPHAQYWLGFMIANGRGGIASNWCSAAALFTAAVEDVPDASFMLGIIHNEGRIGPIDYQKAAYWYRKATSKVLNQKAQFNLRVLIEGYLVEWQEGDPGKPPPPKPIEPVEKLQLVDPAPDNVG